jgi:hypothetical protein
MSTGDQTEYIRGKLAERGTSQATFTKDGFDRWAESEAPARAGQMEKIPAETQMASRGGAMSVSQAKKYDAQLRGGAGIRPLNLGGRSFLGVEIPQPVEDAIQMAEKIFDFIELVSKKLPEIEEAIQDEIIDNMDDPALTATDRKNAKSFLTSIIKPSIGIFAKVKQVMDYAKQLKAIVGAGRNGSIRGGATASENFQRVVDFLKKTYTYLRSIFNWFRENGKSIIALLKLRPLQPIGKQILDKVQPFLTLVGLGRHRCGCDDGDSSEEECMRGGAYGIFGEEIDDPVMMASTEMVPYTGKAPAGQSYGSLGMDYSRAQPPSKVQYSPPPSKDLPMDYSRGVAPSDSTRTSKGGRRKIGGAMEMMEEMVLTDPTSEIVAKFHQYMRRLKENVASGKITLEEAKRLADEARRGLDKTLAKFKKGGVTSFKPSVSSSKGRKRGGAFSSMEYGVARSPGGMEEEFYDDSNGMKEYGVNLAPSMKPMSKAEMKREKQQFMANEGFPMDVPKNSGFAMNSGFPMNSGFAMSVPNSNKGGKKSSARGAIVKKVMREKGLSLPQASKYVKEHGLY